MLTWLSVSLYRAGSGGRTPLDDAGEIAKQFASGLGSCLNMPANAFSERTIHGPARVVCDQGAGNPTRRTPSAVADENRRDEGTGVRTHVQAIRTYAGTHTLMRTHVSVRAHYTHTHTHKQTNTCITQD